MSINLSVASFSSDVYSLGMCEDEDMNRWVTERLTVSNMEPPKEVIDDKRGNRENDV